MTKNESVRYRIEEYDIIDETQNQVKVAVKALRPITSRNGRKYTFEEMMQSHRSIRNKLINVNHNDQRKIGNTNGSKITEQKILEVYGTVNKEPYVYMIKNRDERIKGWSVQADFKIAKCIHCGEEFESMEVLQHHLLQEEHIRNIEFEPQEIEFSGLALVVDPEVPGVPGTSHEIVESVRNLMTLEETINQLEEKQENSWLLNKFSNKNIQENYTLSKIALSSNGNVAVGKSSLAGLAEQEEQPDGRSCPEGEHWDEESQACVKDEPAQAEEQEEHECPEGEHWDADKQMCVANAVAEQECPEGEHWSELEQKCVANVAAEQEEHQCGEGEHWDEVEGKCVANTPPEEPAAVEMVKQKITPLAGSIIKETKLKLGEPFAGYTDFADCVAKNSEKDNPEAYCSTIKKDAEMKEAVIRKAYQKIDEVANAVNSLKVAQDDTSWKQRISKVEETLAKVHEWRTVAELKGKLAEAEKAVAKLKAADAQHYQLNASEINKVKAKVAATKPFNAKPLIEKIEAIKPFDDTELKAKIDEITAKLPQLEETIQKQAEDNAKIKEAYEADLAAYKKDLEEYWKPLEAKVKDLEEKKLEEAQSTSSKLEALETKVDNALDKQQGTFKGVAQPPKLEEKKANPDLSYKPGGKQ